MYIRSSRGRKRNPSFASITHASTLTHEYIALGHALLAEHRGAEVSIHPVLVQARHLAAPLSSVVGLARRTSGQRAPVHPWPAAEGRRVVENSGGIQVPNVRAPDRRAERTANLKYPTALAFRYRQYSTT